MNRRTWKRHESWWAEVLGGVRVPVTGRQRGSAPDIEHPTYALEVKSGRVLSPRLREGWAQAQAAAVTSGKLPLLCVTHCSGPGRPNEHYVVCDLATWQSVTGDGPGEAEEAFGDD